MRVQIQTLGEGLHPNEVVVALKTKNGTVEMIVDQYHIKDNSIEVGWPVGHEKGFYLVELPSETAGGSWRVWVASEDIEPDEPIRKRA